MCGQSKIIKEKPKAISAGYFCSLVESYRDENGIPRHRVLINFGLVQPDAVPYLKAAFAKKKPRLVYDDEETS